MHLVHCNNPIKVFNRYTGQFMYVPCRHCDVCLNAYQLRWQQRIVDEMRMHKYCIFFTLTYNEENIPYFIRHNDRFLVNNDGVCIDLEDYTWSVEDHVYIDKLDKIKCVDKKHVQDFMKRLRSRIKYYHNEKIRYFICSEYDPNSENEKRKGSTAHRPHYHGLLFIDSPAVYRSCFGDTGYICQSWKYGFVTSKSATERRGKYVAKYISGYTKLPAIYKVPEFRTFHLASKHPPIGYGNFNIVDNKDILFGSSLWYSRQTDKGLVFDLLPKYVENTFFSKCPKFDEISHDERLALYSFGYSDAERRKDNSLKYSYWLSTRKLDDELEVVDLKIRLSDTRMFAHCFNSMDAYISFGRWCRKIYLLCKDLKISIHDYLTCVEIYWNKKALYKLKEQYEFQSEFVQHDDARLLVNMDLDFIDHLFSIDNKLWLYSSSTYGKLKSFGINPEYLICPDGSIDYKMLEAYSYKCSKDYLKRRSLAYKISNDSVKTKKRNDYKEKLSNYEFKHSQIAAQT